jgi:Tfp pilus assembly protein PilN
VRVEEGGVRPLNLASRPFRNEALPALLFAIAASALLGATLQHGLLLKRLLSVQASALEQEVARLEAESERLRARARELAAVRLDKDAQARWALVKELVDRRVFSWTDLLRRLEQVVPPGVRLVALSPDVQKGTVKISLKAVAQSAEDGIAFVRALEQREEFSGVYLLRADDRQGNAEFDYRLEFRPPPASARPAGAAAPTEDGPAAGEGASDATPSGEASEPEQGASDAGEPVDDGGRR